MQTGAQKCSSSAHMEGSECGAGPVCFGLRQSLYSVLQGTQALQASSSSAKGNRTICASSPGGGVQSTRLKFWVRFLAQSFMVHFQRNHYWISLSPKSLWGKEDLIPTGDSLDELGWDSVGRELPWRTLCHLSSTQHLHLPECWQWVHSIICRYTYPNFRGNQAQQSTCCLSSSWSSSSPTPISFPYHDRSL